MTETIFKLKEKTALLFGPITPLVQAIGAFLVEQGADVAFVDETANSAQRFVNNLMEMRQVHSKYGRSACVNVNVVDVRSAKDAISRAAELFGSIDIMIDANCLTRQNATETMPSELMANQVLEFFNTRGRGRMIFLSYSKTFLEKTDLKSSISGNQQLKTMIKEKCSHLKSKLVTINTIELGLTEELLLKLHPGTMIQSALKLEQKTRPEVFLTEPNDIANLVGFLASPLSTSLNNQVLQATYGDHS